MLKALPPNIGLPIKKRFSTELTHCAYIFSQYPLKKKCRF